MGAPAIRAEGLGKQYTLGRQRRHDMLREAVASSVAGVAARLAGRRASRPVGETLWALRDVTFDVAAGEAVGIVGPNGAGKTTLLKLLSRITAPTEGAAVIAGRVGSLLEVGTGFHHELTGRENIYLSGAILGMRRAEIAARFDEIVEFAEVERFLDTPVKHYSDGMYLRLAFAVAAHLEPEILLVDEVLAVGDARFQKRCLGKMRDIARGGSRTVLFVSHNMSAVQRLCGRTLLIQGGRLADDGPTSRVVGRYLSDRPAESRAGEWIDVSAAARGGTGEARFRAVQYTSGNERAGHQPYPDGPLEFVMEIASDGPRAAPSMGVVFADRHGTKLVNADIVTLGRELRLRPGRNLVRLTIEQLHLNPGVYDLVLWLGDTFSAGYDVVDPAFQIEVVALEDSRLGVTPGPEQGVVTCRCDFTLL